MQQQLRALIQSASRVDERREHTSRTFSTIGLPSACFRRGPEAYRRERLTIVLESVPKNSLLEFPDGRVFSVWYQPMIEGGWVATMEDITETTRARRELQRLHATLEVAKAEAERAAAEARAAHQQLIDASNVMAEGLVLLDAEDRHVLWNQRYAEMLGDARDALSSSARDLRTRFALA